MINYRSFTIEPKRDFGPTGFYINGAVTKIGYLAVKDGCNAMPGATWFHTIESAKEAIDILIAVGGGDIWNRPRSQRAVLGADGELQGTDSVGDGEASESSRE